MTRARILLIALISMALSFDTSATVITNASSKFVADGSAQVLAVETLGGSVSYKISAVPGFFPGVFYNASGLFSGLGTGTYYIRAKSSYGTADLTVFVGYVVTWQPRWRLQHGSYRSDGPKIRIDIEDAEYNSDVIDIKGQTSPDVLTYVNDVQDNVFEPVIGCELVLNLKS